jgi:hypothetical protein
VPARAGTYLHDPIQTGSAPHTVVLPIGNGDKAAGTRNYLAECWDSRKTNWKGLRKKTLWVLGHYPDRPEKKLEKSVIKKRFSAQDSNGAPQVTTVHTCSIILLHYNLYNKIKKL